MAITWTVSNSITSGWSKLICSTSGQYQAAMAAGAITNVYYSTNYGSTWVADSQFIYLGSIAPLDDDTRAGFFKKVVNRVE